MRDTDKPKLVNYLPIGRLNTYLIWAIISLLLYLIFSPLCKAATLIFDDGFESGNLTKHAPQLATAPAASFTVIKSPVASGTYAGRFYLPFVSVDANNYRSETVLRNGGSNFEFNKEYWFSFKFRFEDWADDTANDMAPFQIHVRPSSWDCEIGSAWSHAPFYMWTGGGGYMGFNTYRAKEQWRAPVVKNVWRTITIRFIPSYNSNGLIEAWLNGTKIASVSGANSQQLDACKQPMRGPYLKIGVYKWPWKAGRPATQSTQRTILIDDIKVASGTNGYNTVTGSDPTPSPPPPPDPTPDPTPEPTPPPPTDPSPDPVPPPPDPEVDTLAPVASGFKVSPTDTTAIVRFNTNEPASVKLEYGLTTALGSEQFHPSLTTTQEFVLTGLTPNTKYYYKATVTDLLGNSAPTSLLTFTTGFSYCP